MRSRPNDPEVIRLAGEGSRLGMKYELLAQYCGIAPSSLYKWLKLGREGSERHRGFANAIDDNESKGAARLLARIIQAADSGQWQAAAWVLERRWGYRRDADPVRTPDPHVPVDEDVAAWLAEQAAENAETV